MGRFVPITFTTQVAEKAQPVVPGAKAYYDGKQCWQYKVVYDRPGSYTFTVPSNAICARTVLVGGGGKPKCGTVPADGSGCNSAAGAGGAYSEKCHAITPGSTVFSIVVGRQEQDSTLACNSVAVHTAGGAAGCIPGNASGGDHNSRGGGVGFTCNNCGGSFSHSCGSCKCFAFTTCCGYCVVMQFDPAGVGASTCCNIILAGGGSAGSPRNLCGGCSSCMCGRCHSGIAGGGAGIGDQCVNNVWHYPCCDCICFAPTSDTPKWCIAYPTSVQGGGGSLPRQSQQCRSTPSPCTYGIWKSGDGSPGGPGDANTGEAWTLEWGYSGLCAYPFGVQCWSERDWRCNNEAPCRQDWWDIQDICGTGSAGTAFQITSTNCVGGWKVPGPRPKNSGEGAGTGGILTFCCDPNGFGNMISNVGGANAFSLVNWTKLCCLGTTQQCDQAWLMPDSLFPTFITCAGTLGGSGGVGWCGYTSKAGKGGGGGQAKCQFLCVCWGGSFNNCNGSGPALAFPPCLLDQLLSNAGTGMAIIYYREA